ncbi:hypothetical protein R1sor_022835 [Riccia sorocarpa]|uniref:Uncharacterized protein n=1 Tax=Riccia sorocarpa TaxID=122646 RepID=A0ABD3GRY5_9MARC
MKLISSNHSEVSLYCFLAVSFGTRSEASTCVLAFWITSAPGCEQCENQIPQIQFEQESDGEDHKSAEQAPGGPPPSPAQESVPVADQGTAVQANASGPPNHAVENVEIQPVADIENPQAEGNIEGEILVPKELDALAQNHKPGDQEAGQRDVVQPIGSGSGDNHVKPGGNGKKKGKGKRTTKTTKK